MPFSRAWRYWSRRLLRAVLQPHDSPRQIAGGAAIGMFVGMTPTFGLHMIMAALLATMARCSRLPAILFVYVTNPFTVLPIYGFCYQAGCWVLRPMGFKPLTFRVVRETLASVPKDAQWTFWRTFYQDAHAVLKLGWTGVAPLCLGTVLVGAVAGVMTYWFVLRLVTGHRILKAQRVALRAQKRIERIRRKQELERGNNGNYGNL